MIKQIIFDLDGVLIDSRELHFKSFNSALMNICPEFSISKEEHLSTYDGLPTTKKLELLTQNKGLPKRFYNEIWKKKQYITLNLMMDYTEDRKLILILDKLKEQGIRMSVASNSVRESIITALHNKKILHFFDHIGYSAIHLIFVVNSQTGIWTLRKKFDQCHHSLFSTV